MGCNSIPVSASLTKAWLIARESVPRYSAYIQGRQTGRCPDLSRPYFARLLRASSTMNHARVEVASEIAMNAITRSVVRSDARSRRRRLATSSALSAMLGGLDQESCAASLSLLCRRQICTGTYSTERPVSLLPRSHLQKSVTAVQFKLWRNIPVLVFSSSVPPPKFFLICTRRASPRNSLQAEGISHEEADRSAAAIAPPNATDPIANGFAAHRKTPRRVVPGELLSRRSAVAIANGKSAANDMPTRMGQIGFKVDVQVTLLRFSPR